VVSHLPKNGFQPKRGVHVGTYLLMNSYCGKFLGSMVMWMYHSSTTNDSRCMSIVRPPTTQVQIGDPPTLVWSPVGDSPCWRKSSLADSITFGWIPVVFSNDSNNVPPWFWDHCKSQGRILLDEESRADVLEGRIDLYEWLSSIPPTTLLEFLMQETIATYARQYQYSLTEDRRYGIHIYYYSA